MAEIKRIYRQSLPAVKLVGKKYSEADKVNGTFSDKWSEWFANNLFEPLKLPESAEPFEDCNAFYGVCQCNPDKSFTYWIGVLMPTGAAVPEGYDSIDLDAGDIAVLWVYGKEPDVYMFDSYTKLKEAGYEWTPDKNGIMWCFERYVCPRFTSPDSSGNVILDMCYYVK